MPNPLITRVKKRLQFMPEIDSEFQIESLTFNQLLDTDNLAKKLNIGHSSTNPGFRNPSLLTQVPSVRRKSASPIPAVDPETICPNPGRGLIKLGQGLKELSTFYRKQKLRPNIPLSAPVSQESLDKFLAPAKRLQANTVIKPVTKNTTFGEIIQVAQHSRSLPSTFPYRGFDMVAMNYPYRHNLRAFGDLEDRWKNTYIPWKAVWDYYNIIDQADPKLLNLKVSDAYQFIEPLSTDFEDDWAVVGHIEHAFESIFDEGIIEGDFPFSLCFPIVHGDEGFASDVFAFTDSPQAVAERIAEVRHIWDNPEDSGLTEAEIALLSGPELKKICLYYAETDEGRIVPMKSLMNWWEVYGQGLRETYPPVETGDWVFSLVDWDYCEFCPTEPQDILILRDYTRIFNNVGNSIPSFHDEPPRQFLKDLCAVWWARNTKEEGRHALAT